MVIIIIMVRNDAKDEKIMWIMSIRMMCRVKNVQCSCTDSSLNVGQKSSRQHKNSKKCNI